MGGVVGGITFNDTYGNQIADGWDTHEAYVYTAHRNFTIMLLGFVVLFFVDTPIVSSQETTSVYSEDAS